MNERKETREEGAQMLEGGRGEKEKDETKEASAEGLQKREGDGETNKSERKPGATVSCFPGVATEKVNATNSEYQPP